MRCRYFTGTIIYKTYFHSRATQRACFCPDAHITTPLFSHYARHLAGVTPIDRCFAFFNPNHGAFTLRTDFHFSSPFSELDITSPSLSYHFLRTILWIFLFQSLNIFPYPCLYPFSWSKSFISKYIVKGSRGYSHIKSHFHYRQFRILLSNRQKGLSYFCEILRPQCHNITSLFFVDYNIIHFSILSSKIFTFYKKTYSPVDIQRVIS
jgi:hypothetical protein